MLLLCDGEKCRMKNHCIRYSLEKLKEKDPLKITSFNQICNKKNKYRWIFLDPKCKNKKYKKIYDKRKRGVN